MKNSGLSLYCAPMYKYITLCIAFPLKAIGEAKAKFCAVLVNLGFLEYFIW